MAKTDTHNISPYARPVGRDRIRAECGQLVSPWSNARDARPSCVDCAQLQDEDEATAVSLRQELSQPLERPVVTRIGDPLAGYRPRGRR